MSDLHLESQEFPWHLPKGETLLLAGDLCHAACLSPDRRDPYAVAQRDRALRFIEEAVRNFAHVLLIAGNHDHYDGQFEATIPSLKRAFPDVLVLDDEMIDIDGIRFFGTTLWSDFEGRDPASLEKCRRSAGEFFFVKVRDGEKLRRFHPLDAAAAHHRALAALADAAENTSGKPLVVVSHHAPSLKGPNPLFTGNGFDGAYASDLDAMLASMAAITAWVHGHTHIARSYRIGDIEVHANCRGFDKQGHAVKGFALNASFEIWN